MNETDIKAQIRVLEPAAGVRIFTCAALPLNGPETMPPEGVLGKRESFDWDTRFQHPERRNQWLAGRLAAKFALKDWFQVGGDEAVPSDQFEILSDGQGAPYYAGPFKMDAARLPELSITHTDDLAAAVVHHMKGGLYPGIDLERRGRRLSDRVIRQVFSPREKAVMDALSETEQTDWRLRLWCAREAAAKSLRMGLVGATRHFRAEKIDFKAGTVYVAVSEVPQIRPLFGNKCTIPVKTWLQESYVMAVSLIQ